MKRNRFLTTAVIFLCALLLIGTGWAKTPPDHAKNDNNRHNTIVETKYGRLMGILNANDTWAWKGVPYVS